MSGAHGTVQEHYEQSDSGSALVEGIRQTLAEIPAGPVSATRFAAFDHFHVRGLQASAELADLADIHEGMTVLDAGSGLGGPARYLAERFGCKVMGIDLTTSFVTAARMLTERAGLGQRVEFQVGNLLELPFPDASFDLIWTQHVVMNIQDRDTLYSELHRVLKSAGRLVFYDIFAGDGAEEPYFPVPWAAIRENSHLLTHAETVTCMEQAGFAVPVWNDVTAAAMGWFREQMEQRQQAPPVGPSGVSTQAALVAILGGPQFPGMLQNLARSAREGKVRWVMGVATPVE